MDVKKLLADKEKIKNIVIIILCVLLVFESIAFAIIGSTKPYENGHSTPEINLSVDISGISRDIISTIEKATGDIFENGLTPAGISDLLKNIIYSDTIVNMIMSMGYPLLFEILTNLEMMDFATNIDLYPTGPLLAEKLGKNSFTCCDKDGTRKPLCDVLKNVGSDWSYMDSQVTYTLSDGSSATTSIWNSVDWGITDKDSFYNAIGIMSEGLRGVLEICIQGKSRTVNINVVDFLLHTDAIPINLDAAVIYNSSGKTGYEACLVTLFNALGLNEGEYPSPAEFCAYTNLSDIWKAILEPVLFAVEKAVATPVESLTSMLINFAAIIENGKLVSSMRSMKMDATFHELASAVMGFNNGELYNLGDSLADIIKNMGIDISGSFNNLLDGLIKMISKNTAADLPDMDMTALLSCATTSTLNSGNTYYTADSEKTIDFLVNYIINENIVESIINMTELKGTPEATIIISSVADSKDGLITISETLINYFLKKLHTN